MANFMPLLTELGVIGPKSINRSRLTALLIHGVLIGFSTEPSRVYLHRKPFTIHEERAGGGQNDRPATGGTALCRVPNIWDDTKVVPPSLATGECGHSRLPACQLRQNGFLHVQSVLGLVENRLRVRFESFLVNLLTAMRR
jgi:hypothetical protein